MGRMREDYELVYEKNESNEKNKIDRRSERYWNSVKENNERGVSRIKIFSILLLGGMLILSMFQSVNLTFSIEEISFGTKSILVCCGLLGYRMLSKRIHKTAFQRVTQEMHFHAGENIKGVETDEQPDEQTEEKTNCEKIKNWSLSKIDGLFRGLKKLFDQTVNIDYTIASRYKKELEEKIFIECRCDCKNNTKYVSEKNGRCINCYDLYKFSNKFFIKFSNWLNVACVAFGMFLLLISLIFGDFCKELKDMFIIVLFTMLSYRLISRSLEIGRAFYSDAVRVDSKIFVLNENQSSKCDLTYKEKIYLHKWKNSYIRKPMRISLAVHSLFELTLMFAMMYILTFLIFNVGALDTSKVGEYITGTGIYEFLLYSISLSFFNISFINYGLLAWNILHVWQVAMSMILIILSLAAYLGEGDDVSERESDFYASVLSRKTK
ncbi:hypothetical protein CN520_28685 [Bacillus cereus]|uniref:hypothetical protein n=1 Tax=Bacillus cereus TaxID=1396 RepID=UPI000BED4A01|nr:hypothetical protein [Bacillus cereus]PDZ41603.1 hypothetical protein CON18_03280 [Bacillus cereus]PET36875.1 hypothetical protein CN520_28685 [Bacillus cereus]PFA07482.1 hypothetical protein CN377_20355 [Bacillus cereus]PFS70479.1 hypothetical protein COK49_27465 [Bacillus cereus]PGP96217.1 hypothetical protein COA10_23900 [Bacillus cereus]